MRLKILYISYDGLLEPLGQSQVLAYQAKLAIDSDVYLLSFEKTHDWDKSEQRSAVVERTQAAGINWRPKRYHKRPSVLATLLDIVSGTVSGAALIIKHGINIVHARSYVAAVIGLLLKRLTGVRFVFDMRGFWADERVDGGLWRRDSRMYRVAKWFERQFLLQADHVVSLTHAGASEIAGFSYLKHRLPPITVIPTCVDLARFNLLERSIGDKFVLGYVGSVGTWYLFDQVLRVFKHLLVVRPNARLLVLNRDNHQYIRERLARADVPLERVELVGVDHAEVPSQMARMSAGVFFYKPCYSRLACAPTKLGEFLGCGLPCLVNDGVGDMAAIIRDDNVGVVVEEFSDEALVASVNALVDLAEYRNIAQRCRASAEDHFSLDDGVRQYRSIYESLVL